MVASELRIKWEAHARLTNRRHVRTVKEPVQPIPLFEELISLIMEPENQHVSLNIDCKMQNDPNIMFVSTCPVLVSSP